MTHSNNFMHHIFGHRSPDTDAIVSALVLAEYFRLQGVPSASYRLGKMNGESTFLLNLVSARPPIYLDPDQPYDILHSGDIICLTDHNETAQSINHLEDFTISHVIDHHKIALNTKTPAYIRIMPVGCTCTILLDLFTEKRLPITAKTATLMLGAIISDTLNLQSPTTTDSDILAVDKLAKIAQIHRVDEFAERLFTAKSNLTHLSAQDILLGDYKEFSFNEMSGTVKWGIAGIETMDSSYVFNRMDELTSQAALLKNTKNLDYLMIAVVDIRAKTSFIMAYDEAQNAIIRQAFDINDDGKLFTLKGIVSRKKQLVPTLAHYHQSFSKN
ncbi:manganese-dependent inorganic pyrophosphatase [Moraxella nasovis]|uniref:manganese-dependent inorganic pyrophosphatase n=1 Tax=Moraxella nasovis TaxID=2904121 RepID=UPI001F611A72|nr:manganese-dependent inorganic pyrophosphatase [Moraxella nasovis]UNU73998.1 manganese-dependent inorganic pyrophosphatase [Moraxella nasovis]